MHTRRSFVLALSATAALLAAVVPAAALAATSGVECGVINAYTAPIPAGPTPGSIQFGFNGPVEVIDAAAAIDPVVVTELPNYIGNGGLTCLDVTADGGGTITGLAFAAGGQISGPVTFDVGQDAYIVADRIFVPSSELVNQPELVAVIQVPYEAGETLTVTLTIDTTTGNLTNVQTASQVSGSVAFNGGADLLIDGATLLATYLSGDALGALQVADATGADADVDIAGQIDTTNGNFIIAIGVDTFGCTTVDARSASSITLDGVSFALGNGATAVPSLTTGVEAGVRIQVATDGTLTITEVTVPGCGSVAPIDPPATDTDADTSASIAAIGDISGIGLLAGVLIAWYGAAVALRRRTTRPTHDR
jgi:hypothetical protein